jgi:hypothetical protein
MTFSSDLTTDIGKVRLELGDTVSGSGVRPGGINFTDEEIAAILAEETTINPTLVRLMNILSREWAVVVDITLGPRKEAFSQVSKRYAALADQLRKDAGVGSAGTTVRLQRTDGYRTAHDNGTTESNYDAFGWPRHYPHGGGEFR